MNGVKRGRGVGVSSMTAAKLQATLPKGCAVALMSGRVVIVWTGPGPMPREVLARFGNKQERRENAREDHR